MATREERERAQLAQLKAKYDTPPAKPKRRAAPDDSDPGELIIATGRQAAALIGRWFDGDQLPGDDEDQDDDDDPDDDEPDDDAEEDPADQDAPPPSHGFYRRGTRQRR